MAQWGQREWVSWWQGDKVKEGAGERKRGTGKEMRQCAWMSVILLHVRAHAGNPAKVEQKPSKERRAPESFDRLRVRRFRMMCGEYVINSPHGSRAGGWVSAFQGADLGCGEQGMRIVHRG